MNERSEITQRPTDEYPRPKMNPVKKKQWVKALRSKKFKQGQGMLCVRSTTARGKPGYCCLGVLASIEGIPDEKLFGNQVLDDVGRKDLLGSNRDQWGEPLTTDGDEIGFRGSVQQRLAGMNDKGKPFSEIADWIEENL